MQGPLNRSHGSLTFQPSELSAGPSQSRPQYDDDHVQDNKQTWPHLHLPSPSQRPPSPPAPIPIPSPVPGVRALADLTINPDTHAVGDLESGMGHQRTSFGDARRPGRRSFVGGFISGLKRLPRALTKTQHPNERSTDRASDSMVVASLGNLDDYGNPLPTPSSTSHSILPPPPGFEGEQATSPTLRASTDHTHEDQLEFQRSATAIAVQPNSSSVAPVPAVPSNSSQTTTPTTPISIEPNPTSDYAKMGDPASPPEPPTDPSLTSYLTRLRQFVKAVNDLPWIAPRTTVDYIPGRFSNETQRSHPRRDTLSWYAAPPDRHSLDLLSRGPISPEVMTRLPDSSSTLVSQPDLGVHPFHISPAYDPPPASTGKPIRSHSVQFYTPQSRYQPAPNSYPYPIPRPPPARIS